MNQKDIYNKPWILHRADPYVLKAEDGTYYFTATVPEYDRITIRHSERFCDLDKADEKVIWRKHENGPQSENVWAPEIHFLFGKWYIYYAASDVDDIWALRPYVLECTGDDPMTDPWIEKGKMVCSSDDDFSFRAFSLDGTVFKDNDIWYYIWAEKVGVGKQISNLYIAKMKNAYSLDSVQVLLTTPDYDWERHGFWVNEGPSVLKRNGRIYLTFSASETDSHYCIGMMTASSGSDLLDPLNWRKERYPVLETSPDHLIYGPGHNSFSVDDDGRDVMIYHARCESDITGDPLFNPNRHTMIMPVAYEEGRPVFSYDTR